MATSDYLRLINEQRALHEFVELARIDSGSLDERLMADALRPRLEALGAVVREDGAGEALGGNAGNLLAWIPGTAPGPTVLLSAHMDRVKPGHGIRPIIDPGSDGTFHTGAIRSDGRTILAADDVAGIVSVLEGLRVLQENALPYPPVVVTFTIAEEMGLQGAKALDASELGADLGFVFDASGEVGTLILAAPHEVKLDIAVHGLSAHAGIEPEKGVNAILVGAEAIAGMRMGRIDEITTSNIGIFNSGLGTNVVPCIAEIKGEVRSHSRPRLDEEVSAIRLRFEEAARCHGASVDFAVHELYPGFGLGQDSPAATLAFQAALALSVGIRPVFARTGGGSDANILNSIGIPSVALGTGFEKAHSVGERIPFGQLVRGCALAAAIVHLAGAVAMPRA